MLPLHAPTMASYYCSLCRVLRGLGLSAIRFYRLTVRLGDLAVPPGNRLEPLSGARKGQHSIRINDQYRVCFVWDAGDAYEVGDERRGGEWLRPPRRRGR
jgi:hypothetical protein